MQHLKENLRQAALYSVRQENKRVAERALELIEGGKLKTRTQYETWLEQAMREAKTKEENNR